MITAFPRDFSRALLSSATRQANRRRRVAGPAWDGHGGSVITALNGKYTEEAVAHALRDGVYRSLSPTPWHRELYAGVVVAG